MKYLTKEVKIALVAIVGIVTLFFGLQYLKGLTMFSTDENYYAKFSDVSGLSSACPVFANGYKVGVVEDIIYDYEHPERIVAVLGIDSKLNLPKGTVAEIASDLLGNVKLELKLGQNPLDLLAKGDTILGQIHQGALGKAGDMVPQIERMLPKLDSILASVNALLADPALGHALHNIDDVTTNLTATTNELHHLSVALNSQVPQMLTKADGVLANTEGLTYKLNSIDISGTMSKVDATLNNLQQMSRSLNSREGTLGLLLHDPQLYNNLNATMQDADQLMIDLKAHPQRYVHFSVFGKKNK